mmetsp:Transcript_7884/g.21032  ORF Transcript_7884/g.21032 Transcript_7884/m.21032 type:complete len:149 (+) Transcript_7884:1773-2219(+)
MDAALCKVPLTYESWIVHSAEHECDDHRVEAAASQLIVMCALSAIQRSHRCAVLSNNQHLRLEVQHRTCSQTTAAQHWEPHSSTTLAVKVNSPVPAGSYHGGSQLWTITYGFAAGFLLCGLKTIMLRYDALWYMEKMPEGGQGTRRRG